MDTIESLKAERLDQAHVTATNIWEAVNRALEANRGMNTPVFTESMRDKTADGLRVVFAHVHNAATAPLLKQLDDQARQIAELTRERDEAVSASRAAADAVIMLEHSENSVKALTEDRDAWKSRVDTWTQAAFEKDVEIGRLTKERDEALERLQHAAKGIEQCKLDGLENATRVVTLGQENHSLKRQLEAAREAAISAVDTLAADYIAEAKKLNEAAAHNGSSLYVSERKPAWAEEVKTAIHKALSTLTDKGEDAQKGGC